MGSSGLPRVPRVPERSQGFQVSQRSQAFQDLWNSKDIKAFVTFAIFQGSTFLMLIKFSRIHMNRNLQCFQLMLFSGYSTKGSSKGSSINSRKALRKDDYFLTFRRTFEFS